MLSLKMFAVPAMLIALAGCVTRPVADPGAVYRQHKDAIGRADVRAAMALLSDDVTYVAGPQCRPDQPCVGKDAAEKGFVAWAVGLGMTVQAIGPTVNHGGVARTPAEVRWTDLPGLGVQRLRGFDDVTLDAQGRIQRLVFSWDTSDAQTAAFLQAASASPPAAR